MESRIARELKLRYQAVAILFGDERPEEALQPKPGVRYCVVASFTAAAKGRTAAFDRETVSCPGGGVGLCFGNTYAGFPGGIEYFLSTGRPGYREGEAYRKTPELARSAVAEMPKVEIPQAYVIFKPLPQVDPARETPQLVTFYCSPDQLAACITLASYARPTRENTIVPSVSGCQSIALVPYLESLREVPRAVLGMVDLSARPHVDADILTFTVPFSMFQQMEADVPGSFLEKGAWKKVRARIPDPPQP